MEGHWLTISEYSTYRKKSISTIRRYIKSERVKYKLEEGKYLIYVTDENYRNKKVVLEKDDMELRMKLVEYEAKIRKLEEENNDLKMLVSIYEREKKAESLLPDLPEMPNEI
jgi:Na+/phosphate symporter